MLVLIDGSNLAHRSVHAAYKDLGHYSYIDAIPYFFKRLSGLLEYHHLMAGVLIAWDKGIPLHRRQIYSEYKPDSKPVGNIDPRFLSKINQDPSLSPHRETKGNESFLSEYSKFIEIMSEFAAPLTNCLSVRVENVEADDIIAYCCYHLKGVEKQIISSDKDLLQLVDETTSVYNFSSPNPNSNVYDYDWIMMNYDYPKRFREAFLVEKAILGDTSDNIPGIELVGSTTAKKYTNSIIRNRINGMSLNEAIDQVERPERASKKGYENLKNSPNIIQRNYDLMDLHLPIHGKFEIVKNIQKVISGFLNLELDYYDALDRLEEREDFPFNKCYTSIDKVYESNCNYDRKFILEKIRDAT